MFLYHNYCFDQLRIFTIFDKWIIIRRKTRLCLRKEAIIVSYSSCSLTIKISFLLLLIFFFFYCYFLFCFVVFCLYLFLLLFCIFFHIWQIATLVVYNLRWCLIVQCLCIYTKIAKLHDNNGFFFYNKWCISILKFPSQGVNILILNQLYVQKFQNTKNTSNYRKCKIFLYYEYHFLLTVNLMEKILWEWIKFIGKLFIMKVTFSMG